MRLDTSTFRCCFKCGCTKPETPDFFPKHKQMRKGLLNKCKICDRLDHRAHYQRNKARHSERCAEWRRNNPERKRAGEKAWREANKERKRQVDLAWKAANLDRVRRNWKRWREENRERYNEIQRVGRQTRLALLAEAEGTFTAAEITRMYVDQGGLCAYCERELDNEFDIDHMMPLSRGGRNDWTNLALACVFCNRSKHAKTVLEFLSAKYAIT